MPRRRFLSAGVSVLLAISTLASVSLAQVPVRCFGRVATIVGTLGADVVRGTSGPDVINALGGDDVVRGLGGGDLVCGGEGADELRGGPGDDRLSGGAGDDLLRGGPGSDRLQGRGGADTLEGGGGSDRVFGGAGDDVLIGAPPGLDALRGGSGGDACFLGKAGATRGCDPVVAAAGDIACDPALGAGTAGQCRMRATSNLLVGTSLRKVLTLGDNQYPDGALAAFLGSYDRSWGRVKGKTRPSPGNHEYWTLAAQGYFDYFGKAAGTVGKGYYSFDVGAWHLVALNSNCGAAGGCDADSPQVGWLRADLAANGAACTLAYWHHPRFSSGPHGDDPTYAPFWRALFDAWADLVLVGHDHDYERFAPQTPAGRANPGRGIREFVVGTGGVGLRGFDAVGANSQRRNGKTFGVLLLALHSDGYTWLFTPAAGGSFRDVGSGDCV